MHIVHTGSQCNNLGPIVDMPVMVLASWCHFIEDREWRFYATQTVQNNMAVSGWHWECRFCPFWHTGNCRILAMPT